MCIEDTIEWSVGWLVWLCHNVVEQTTSAVCCELKCNFVSMVKINCVAQKHLRLTHLFQFCLSLTMVNPSPVASQSECLLNSYQVGVQHALWSEMELYLY